MEFEQPPPAGEPVRVVYMNPRYVTDVNSEGPSVFLAQPVGKYQVFVYEHPDEKFGEELSTGFTRVTVFASDSITEAAKHLETAGDAIMFVEKVMKLGDLHYRYKSRELSDDEIQNLLAKEAESKMAEDKKYMVYEIEGEEHSESWLHQFGTDSIIEAVKEQFRMKCDGILILKDGKYEEFSQGEQNRLFMEELQSLVENDEHEKLRGLLIGSPQPPQEFLDFLNTHIKEPSMFATTNPYDVRVEFTGDQDNLLFVATDAEVLERRSTAMKSFLKKDQEQ